MKYTHLNILFSSFAINFNMRPYSWEPMLSLIIVLLCLAYSLVGGGYRFNR
jgi:hypothetical protein